ncbi:MAG: oligoendopeptidase F [Streptococcaceae bacterium]|jgi:oligoendopeptidase F|nr:oligoendopeptidase F [Streptococcaceae bacterium]
MKQVKLPKREELAVADTWNLSLIFPNDEAWEDELEQLTKQLSAKKDYEGTLKDGAKAFLKAMEWQFTIFRRLQKIYMYASLKHDQDTTNAKYQMFIGQAGNLYAQVAEAVSWFEPELLSLSDKLLAKYFTEFSDLAIYKHFVEGITEQRAHINSAEVENVLASVSDVLSASSETFRVLNDADLKFANIIDDNGQLVQLTNGNFVKFLESTKQDVRKQAFENIYKVYEQLQHTVASTLNGEIKANVFSARIRNYQSSREVSLKSNHIPEKVYDMLVATVNKHLPLLHRYIAFRKKILGVKELHSYDLYTPLLGKSPLNFTYKQAKEKTLESLASLGEDYLAYVRHAFNHRVIDVYENEGKRSGAFSGGAYDTEAYILLNWQNTLDNLYTLVHEMGHSANSYYTWSTQPYVYGHYPIFLAEIASTTNENILTEYLLKNEKDLKIRAYVLNHYLDGFKGNIFRQTQFAEFEHYINQQVEAGMPLTADSLSKYYGDLNVHYYGEALTFDSQIALEWARIPHFYRSYYVFQYATGFAAANDLSQKIVHGNQEDVNRYLDFLKTGSSAYPLDVMKKAGVDMLKADYLEAAFGVFEKRLDELEKIVESL